MKAIRLAQMVLLAVGLAALGYCLAVYLEANRFQADQARRFTRELHRHAAAPAPASPADGAVLAQMQIPRLGMSVMVVEGANDGDLRRAAGHIPGTALPGQNGNVAIAGHRDTFFRPLRRLHPGDAIVLRTLAGVSRYRVVSLHVVRPADIAVLYPTRRDALTLVTCFPFDYIGAAPARFVVRAERLPENTAGAHPAPLPPLLRNRLGAAAAGRGAELPAAYRP